MSAMSADEPPPVPDGLLARLRAQPSRAPDIVALEAAERFGPAAAAWAVGQRKSGADLARVAVKRHARLARFAGAAGGVGGAFTMLPDMAALVWIQARMVFYVAAALGYDPEDPMRPAELLVLFELYDDPVAARAALDGTGKALSRAMVERSVSSRGTDDGLGARLARMALRRGSKRLAGRFVPVLAVAVNAVGNERATRGLGADAISFYGG